MVMSVECFFFKDTNNSYIKEQQTTTSSGNPKQELQKIITKLGDNTPIKPPIYKISMKHHKVLTAQESSSLSLSMQGREELDEASPGFFSFDSLPPSPTLLPSFSTHAFFPSFSTQAFFSFFFLPLSIHQKMPRGYAEKINQLKE